MTKPKDGGPAFPQHKFEPTHGGGGHMTTHGGMTLRDWFAGQAMAGFGANPETYSWDFAVMAKACYAQADAMLAARKGGGA